MRRMLSTAIVAAVCLAASAPAWAEPASVLLEKGIFNEETRGDLDVTSRPGKGSTFIVKLPAAEAG